MFTGCTCSAQWVLIICMQAQFDIQITYVYILMTMASVKMHKLYKERRCQYCAFGCQMLVFICVTDVGMGENNVRIGTDTETSVRGANISARVNMCVCTYVLSLCQFLFGAFYMKTNIQAGFNSDAHGIVYTKELKTYKCPHNFVPFTLFFLYFRGR